MQDVSGFGYQWQRYSRIGYDSYNGTDMSERRFFDETGWPRDMAGQTILEAGCGAGRYTEQALRTGATVVSIDLSDAVKANHAAHGTHPRSLIAQASFYSLPFAEKSFDWVFCFGVLQHTPDPTGAFRALARVLKPGGSLVVDLYARQRGLLARLKEPLSLKRILRPLTRRMSPASLHRLCEAYTRLMWPVGKMIHRLPKGKELNWRLCIADYWDEYDMPDAMLKDMAVCDLLDMLQPRYDLPQYAETVRQWYQEAGFTHVEVWRAWNGWCGRGSMA